MVGLGSLKHHCVYKSTGMKLLHGHSDTHYVQHISSHTQYTSTYIHIAVIPKSHGGDHFRPKLSSPGFEVCALAFIAGTTEAVYSLVEHEASMLYAFLK